MTARVLACLLLAAPLLGGCLSDRTFGESLDDASAATEIKTRLLGAGLNGRFMEVDVAVVDRFVLLSGRVASEADRKEAERIAWTTTSVDVVTTIHEVCQMVFFDQSVDKETRKRRANGVKNLGQIFQATPEPPAAEGKKSARAMFEEAALAATIETMKRKDEASHEASYGS